MLPPLIYLVDDEPVILDLLARCLAKEEYRTLAFVDPLAAYAAFAAADPKPDLMITDYTMAGMDGLELVRRCRVLVPALKVLSVSGTLTSDAIGAAAAKPDECLQKPFMAAALLAAVHRLLEQAGT